MELDHEDRPLALRQSFTRPWLSCFVEGSLAPILSEAHALLPVTRKGLASSGGYISGRARPKWSPARFEAAHLDFFVAFLAGFFWSPPSPWPDLTTVLDFLRTSCANDLPRSSLSLILPCSSRRISLLSPLGAMSSRADPTRFLVAFLALEVEALLAGDLVLFAAVDLVAVFFVAPEPPEAFLAAVLPAVPRAAFFVTEDFFAAFLVAMSKRLHRWRRPKVAFPVVSPARSPDACRQLHHRAYDSPRSMILNRGKNLSVNSACPANAGKRQW